MMKIGRFYHSVIGIIILKQAICNP